MGFGLAEERQAFFANLNKTQFKTALHPKSESKTKRVSNNHRQANNHRTMPYSARRAWLNSDVNANESNSYKHFFEDSSYDENEYDLPKIKRRRIQAKHLVRDVIDPKEITEDMDGVADRHLEKSLDNNVRGQFCGICLHNRYGGALKNPNCRGEFNCSICKNPIGKEVNGVITPLAHAQGYSCAKDFLESLGSGTCKIQEEEEYF